MSDNDQQSGGLADTGSARPDDGNAGEAPPALRPAIREYFAMLAAELRGHGTNGNRNRWRASPDSAAHRRQQGQISATLLSQGLPCTRGRPPQPGAPAGLREAVGDYLRNHPELLRLMEEAVFRPEPRRDFSQATLLGSLVEPPVGAGEIHSGNPEPTPLSGADFLAGEQRNRSLAQAGEQFVFAFEQQRLCALGLHKYADMLEHASQELGDHAGYDIQSWHADGSEVLIRVKTTRFGPQTPFYLSEHELALAHTYGHRYAIYRVFDFGPNPRLYLISGGIDQRCQLQPSVYRAHAL